MRQWPEYLSDDDLETILACAANGQSGRITLYEIRHLVYAYRVLNKVGRAVLNIAPPESLESGSSRSAVSDGVDP